jgi:cytochrome c oxidase cbb3-type subunit 2
MATAHDKVEKNIGLMIILIIGVISVGGLVQIVPLFFQDSLTEPVAGLDPSLPCGNRALRSLLGCRRICL